MEKEKWENLRMKDGAKKKKRENKQMLIIACKNVDSVYNSRTVKINTEWTKTGQLIRLTFHHLTVAKKTTRIIVTVKKKIIS